MFGRERRKYRNCISLLLLFVLLFTQPGLPARANDEDAADWATVEDGGEADTVADSTAAFIERYGVDTDIFDDGVSAYELLMGNSYYTCDNALTIMAFLTGNMNLHTAAAVGILTNIYCESSFKPDALGDGGTSYGICQWHLGRWDNLKDYCDKNGYDWKSLSGQLHFLKYEVDSGYPNTMKAIRATKNNADGAGESARLWCKNFEVPADTEAVSYKRRDLAVNEFWPEYKDYNVEYIDELPDEHENSDEDEPAEPYEVLGGDVPADGEIPEGIWLSPLEDKEYSGAALKQDFRVYSHTRLLLEKSDYTVSYQNNKAAGTATVLVKLKGNYSGSVSGNFTINPASLEGAAVEAISVNYNGKVQKPVPVLTLNGRKLKKDSDYIIPEYEEDMANGWRGSVSGNVGVTLTLRGIGNYSGELPCELCYIGKTTTGEAALPQVQLSKASIAAIPAQNYSGSEFTIESLSENSLRNKKGGLYSISIRYKGKLLTDEDVKVLRVVDAIYPGKATIIFCGRNAEVSGSGYSFVGTKSASFNINGLPISKCTIAGLEKNYEYTGSEICPDFTLSSPAGISPDDYDVEYSGNIMPGKATISVKGKNIYSGTKKFSFRINPISIEGDDFSVKYSDGKEFDKESFAVMYEKAGCTPQLRLYWKDKKLMPGTDYILTYKNNKKAAEAGAKNAPTLMIKGRGAFKGKLSYKFSIIARPFSAYINISLANVPESGTPGKYSSTPIIWDTDGSLLKQGSDYTKPKYYLLTADGRLRRLGAFDAPKEGDTIYACVNGCGGYRGETVYASYKVTDRAKNIAKAGFSITDQTYNGSPRRLGAAAFSSASLNGTALNYGTDYYVVPGSYSNNVKCGTAAVTLIGKGEYGGSIRLKFKIIPE